MQPHVAVTTQCSTPHNSHNHDQEKKKEKRRERETHITHTMTMMEEVGEWKGKMGRGGKWTAGAIRRCGGKKGEKRNKLVRIVI